MPRSLDSSLATAIESFLRARWDIKPNTARTYRNALKRFAKTYEAIGDVTADNVNEYLAGIADHRTMARNDCIALRQFSQWATKSRIFQRDPLESVSLPRGHHTKRRPFTDEDAAQLIGEASSSPFGVRDRAIVVTAISTALRPAELFSLRLSDVDLQDARITVRRETTKSAAGERVIPLSSMCVRDLEAYIVDERAPTKGGELWLNNHGDPLKFGGFMAIWHRLRDRLREKGIDGIQAYRARHTGITNWALSGVPTPTLKQLAGHKSIVTTENYIGALGPRDLARVPDSFTERYGRLVS